MSLYPLSTDRHLSFAAQHDILYDDRLWQHPDLPYYPRPHLANYPFQPPPWNDLPDLQSAPSYHHDQKLLGPTYSRSPALSSASSSIDNNWNNPLYYIDDEDSSSDLPDPQPSNSVKPEPHDAFIVELRAAPSEDTYDSRAASSNVPLRATHACGEMLAMMGVFRLDPFIVRGAAWKPEENTGLDQSPAMFEFTVDLPEEPDCSEPWPQDEQEQVPADLACPEREYNTVLDHSNSLYYPDSYPDYTTRSSREPIYQNDY